MKKHILTATILLLILFSACTKDITTMRVPVVEDNNPKYYMTLLNLGVLLDNKRPHPGKPFNLYFYYTSVDSIEEVQLLGKKDLYANRTLPVAQRYANMQVIKTYKASDAIYSKSYGADSLYITWDIPADARITTDCMYYRIAMKTVKGMRDTTAGDYWQVLAPSNDATLSAIYVNGKAAGLSPTFVSTNLNYAYNIAPSTTVVPTITVAEFNASSSFMITPATSLTGAEVERTTVITVISESGTVTKIYKVTFNKTL